LKILQSIHDCAYKIGVIYLEKPSKTLLTHKEVQIQAQAAIVKL